MDEKEMQRCLRGFLSQPRFNLANLYIFGWESDLALLTRSGYWYEIEIKVSRSDFLADAAKTTQRKGKWVKKSEVLTGKVPDDKRPNYFYYAVPDGMLGVQEVPEYAGLIVVRGVGDYMIIKPAPRLHKWKVDPNDLGLLDKFYYNMVNAKIEQRAAKNEVKATERKYADIAAMVKEERRTERRNAVYDAEYAFKKSCPEYKEFGCAIGGRCGGCERIEKFTELLEKQK